MNFRKLSPIRILILAGILIGIAVIGTIGFIFLEGQDPMAAFLTTVNLLSTVGMGEMPTSTSGQLLAVFLIATGVGTLFYAFTTLVDFLIGGYLAEIMGERSMKKKIAELDNHFLICGFGRVGEMVAKEFTKAGEKFVVVDSNPSSIAHCREHGFLHIEGDAADDEVLRDAGLLKARGLVACVDSDADNVFVTLTARVLGPDLQIVARANSEETRNKLERAGADKVVSPYSIGGREMANLMMKPMVSDYLEVVTGGGELEIRIEQFHLFGGSPAVGKSIEELNIRQITGTSILAVRKPGGSFDTNPNPHTLLEENDVLITAGTPSEIQSLEKMIIAPAAGGN
jgi:voltage-gated potassium channel